MGGEDCGLTGGREKIETKSSALDGGMVGLMNWRQMKEILSLSIRVDLHLRERMVPNCYVQSQQNQTTV